MREGDRTSEGELEPTPRITASYSTLHIRSNHRNFNLVVMLRGDNGDGVTIGEMDGADEDSTDRPTADSVHNVVAVGK